jgi:haloalkane dehalogenase
MRVLRTPDICFADLDDFPFKPRYTMIRTADGTGLRIHHVDEGPHDGLNRPGFSGGGFI